MKPLILFALSLLPTAAAAGQPKDCCAKAEAYAFDRPAARELLRQQAAPVGNHSFAIEGDSLVVSFDACIPARYISSGEAYVLRPVLVKRHGESPMPALAVEGSHYYLVADDCPCTEKVRYEGDSMTVHYSRKVLMTSELRSAGLRVDAERRWTCACKNASAAVGSTTLEETSRTDLSPFAGKTQILYYIPAERTEAGTYVHDFGGRSVFRNNGTTVDKTVFDPAMKEVLEGYEQIKGDPSLEIQAIDVKVASSPDGKYAYNEHLAQTRARNIRAHLAKGFENADLERVTVTAEAENWETFEQALPGSDISDKAAVERILTEYADADEREAELRKLPEWPAVYRIFNDSRNCRIEIRYRIRKSHPTTLQTTEEGLIETRLNAPSGYITVDEAARVAAIDGSAAHLNNLMVACIEQGAYDKALECAARISDEQTCPAVANNKAVLYDLTGDRAAAEACFERATVPAARYNRGVMALNAGDETAAEELLEPYIEK